MSRDKKLDRVVSELHAVVFGREMDAFSRHIWEDICARADAHQRAVAKAKAKAEGEHAGE